MRRILLGVILTASVFLCIGCSAKNIESGTYDERIAKALDTFDSTLQRKENSWEKIYPDYYAGYYVDGDTLIFRFTDMDKASEYEHLKEIYPKIRFKKAVYSYNYLQDLVDEYIASHKDNYTNYGTYIDVKENRAIVYVDEKTLADMHPDAGIPLSFEEPPALTAL